MPIQLQTAYDSFKRLKKDISDVDLPTFCEWCDFINKFLYRELIATDQERFINALTLTTTIGVASYALPADFRDIGPIGCGLFEVDSTGVQSDRQLTKTGFGQQTRGYYISGSNLILTPTPVITEQYTMRYIPTITQLTTLGQYFTMDGTVTGTEIIPDEYLRNLRDAIDVQYGVWDEEVGAESYSDARFVRSLDELLRNIRKDVATVGLPDFSGTF
jgi:hypothetical protein